MALLAAGVSTALPCEAGAPCALPVCGAPILLPEVPLFRAFAVLGPGDPPVPLIELPFESVEPDAPPAPEAAPVAPPEAPAPVPPPALPPPPPLCPSAAPIGRDVIKTATNSAFSRYMNGLQCEGLNCSDGGRFLASTSSEYRLASWNIARRGDLESSVFVGVALMRISGWVPSIVPVTADQTVYLVENDFAAGRAFVETDSQFADLETIILSLLEGQYSDPARVVAFNVAEGWCADVSEDVAHELRRRSDLQLCDVPSVIQDFVERHEGHRQLELRLV